MEKTPGLTNAYYRHYSFVRVVGMCETNRKEAVAVVARSAISPPPRPEDEHMSCGSLASIALSTPQIKYMMTHQVRH